MAQAITKVVQPVKTETELEAQRLHEVRKQTAVDSDGLIEGLKLLQAMHDRGVLELLVALFERGDKVLKLTMDVLEQPGATRVLKSLVTGMEALGKIDPTAISNVAKVVSAGVNNVTQASISEKSMGVFELMRQLKDPDISAAVQTGLAFLKGAGQTLRNENKDGISS